MAEPLTRAMGSPRSARAVAMVAVPSTREERISCLYAVVHRWSPTPAPARWTTAVTPDSSRGSSVRIAGSHQISWLARGGRRTRCTTSSPRASRNADSALPISPDAPLMATRCSLGLCADMELCGIRRGVLEAQGGLEGPLFKAGLHRHQEPCCVRAVNHPVVVRQRQIDDGADRDRLATVAVLDHDGALDDRTGSEDGDVGLVDDRGVEQSSAAAGVGEREGATSELIGGDLVRTGPFGQVGDLACQAGDIEVTGV